MSTGIGWSCQILAGGRLWSRKLPDRRGVQSGCRLRKRWTGAIDPQRRFPVAADSGCRKGKSRFRMAAYRRGRELTLSATSGPPPALKPALATSGVGGGASNRRCHEHRPGVPDADVQEATMPTNVGNAASVTFSGWRTGGVESLRPSAFS